MAKKHLPALLLVIVIASGALAASPVAHADPTGNLECRPYPLGSDFVGSCVHCPALMTPDPCRLLGVPVPVAGAGQIGAVFVGDAVPREGHMECQEVATSCGASADHSFWGNHYEISYCATDCADGPTDGRVGLVAYANQGSSGSWCVTFSSGVPVSSCSATYADTEDMAAGDSHGWFGARVSA